MKYFFKKIYILIFSQIIFVSDAVIAETEIQGQWLDSEKLKPGMKILTADNRLLTVEKQWKQRQKKLTTYNFEVANHHSYFVSSQMLWVHNACIGDLVRHPNVSKVTTRKRVVVRDGRKYNVNTITVEVDDAITDEGIRQLLTTINQLNKVYRNTGLPVVSRVADITGSAGHASNNIQRIRIAGNTDTVRRVYDMAESQQGLGYPSLRRDWSSTGKSEFTIADHPEMEHVKVPRPKF